MRIEYGRLGTLQSVIIWSEKGKITMLFYTCIFVGSLIAVLLACSFYRAIANINSSVHSSSKREAITGGARIYQKEMTAITIDNGIPNTSVQKVRVVPSNPGKTGTAKAVDCNDQNTAWLIREKRLLAMNESFKVRRRLEPQPLTLAMVSKPFRRKAAL